MLSHQRCWPLDISWQRLVTPFPVCPVLIRVGLSGVASWCQNKQTPCFFWRIVWWDVCYVFWAFCFVVHVIFLFPSCWNIWFISSAFSFFHCIGSRGTRWSRLLQLFSPWCSCSGIEASVFFSFDELDSAGEMHPPIFSILHLPLIPFPTPSIFFVCVLAKLCIIAEEYVDYGAVVAISPSLHNSNSIILLAPYFVSFAFFFAGLSV